MHIKVSSIQKQLSLSNTNNFSKYPNSAYSFMIKSHVKSISIGLNILPRKNKRCYVYLPIHTMYMVFTFQRPSSSNNNESLLLLFASLWRLKTKYIVLCLNASPNFQKVSVASYHPALMSSCPTYILALALSI